MMYCSVEYTVHILLRHLSGSLLSALRMKAVQMETQMEAHMELVRQLSRARLGHDISPGYYARTCTC